MMPGGLEQYETLDDHQLVELVLGGDEGAIKFVLMERCGPGFKHLLWKYRTLGLEFHELVSEMCVILMKDDWKALRDFRGTNEDGRSCKIENYIMPMASRFLWKKMGKTVTENLWVRPLYETDSLLATDRADEQRRRAMEVVDAVMAMPNPIERQVILQYKIEGQDVSDVAKTLRTSNGNVYTICSRAGKSLRELLTEGNIHA